MDYLRKESITMSLNYKTVETPPLRAAMLLNGVRSNIVQSIRAFRVKDLQEAAQALGHRFLYANLAVAQSRQEVLDLMNQQFMLSTQVSKNFESLYSGLTDPVHKSDLQPGFVLVLEHIPANAKFDKETREQLLDIFRDAADYWGDRKIPFRCFYSFSVARTAQIEKTNESQTSGKSTPVSNETPTESSDKLPTTKLVDISQQALRMSSPFNSSYWTSP
jgi:hypothetical protein